MVLYEVLSLETTCAGVIPVYLWHSGVLFFFRCAEGGISPMSSVCGAHWSDRLGGYTLIGGAGEDSRVSTIGDGIGVFCYCATTFGGGCSCGVTIMSKTALICCRDSIYLSPSVVSELVWVGLINICVRSAASCVADSSEEILGNGEGVAGKNSVVLETCYLVVLVV